MDYTHLLSIEYLNRIADHCPRALKTYLLCFQNLTPFPNWAIIERSAVEDYYFMSYTRVINDLKALAKEGLLSFRFDEETKDFINVELAEIPNGQECDE